MGMVIVYILSHIQYIAAAIFAYFCGCINGAILTSKFFFKDDVRTHGSGNAGLTNFYRTYGARYALMVIGCDMLKAVLAISVAAWLGAKFDPRFAPDMSLSAAEQAAYVIRFKYWGGLFCIIGHMFPVTAQFRGGKGILCGGTLLLMLDWRIALVGWGAFIALFLLTRYVSLGSVSAAVSLPITTCFVFGSTANVVLATLSAIFVVWGHRKNIGRLLNGTESKFKFHKDGPKSGGVK